MYIASYHDTQGFWGIIGLSFGLSSTTIVTLEASYKSRFHTQHSVTHNTLISIVVYCPDSPKELATLHDIDWIFYRVIHTLIFPTLPFRRPGFYDGSIMVCSLVDDHIVFVGSGISDLQLLQHFVVQDTLYYTRSGLCKHKHSKHSGVVSTVKNGDASSSIHISVISSLDGGNSSRWWWR